MPLLASALAASAAWLLPAPARSHPALDAQVSELSRRVERQPGDARLLLQRAEARREHGELDAARDDLEAALRADPGFSAAHAALARLELEAGRPGRALSACESFLERAPGHPEGLLSRARALSALGRSGSADAWTIALDALEAAGRPQPEIYLEAAAALGAPAIDRALTRLGAVPTVIARGIAIERSAGRAESALARCRDAGALAPSPEWSVLAGEILAEASRSGEAREAFARALEEIAALPPRVQATPFMRDLRERASCEVAP